MLIFQPLLHTIGDFFHADNCCTGSNRKTHLTRYLLFWLLLMRQTQYLNAQYHLGQYLCTQWTGARPLLICAFMHACRLSIFTDIAPVFLSNLFHLVIKRNHIFIVSICGSLLLFAYFLFRYMSIYFFMLTVALWVEVTPISGVSYAFV